MLKQLEIWRSTRNEAAIEAWRKRQVDRMFSLSEFVKCLKFRFTRWYNQRNSRVGAFWESRFTSVMVEEEERALRTIAAYIDLNPVRAGIVADPADYRWCGYAEAMAGKAKARRGLVRIAGKASWAGRGKQGESFGVQISSSLKTAKSAVPSETAHVPPADSPTATKHLKSTPPSPVAVCPWSDGPFPAMVERRALVFYRALLGSQGLQRLAKNGTVIRRGLSERARARLVNSNERLLASEVLIRRVQHFTKGVMLGSRAFVDSWFEANRDVVTGRSRTERQRGSKSLGKPALRGLYALRDSR